MKSSPNLSSFIRQIRPPPHRFYHSFAALCGPPKALPAAVQASIHGFHLPRNIVTSSTRSLNDATTFFGIPRSSCRHSSTQKTPPGSSFTAHVSQNDTFPLPQPEAAQTSESPLPSTTTSSDKVPSPQQRPSYHLVFTCKPCGHRSGHQISKHGYHNGTVLVTCPECKNRHVISDHLKIFSDLTLTIEDLMRDQGELVKRGNINEEGDVEFWEDGSEGRKRDTLAALLKPVNEEAGEEDQETRSAKGAFVKKHGVHQMGNLKRRE